MSVLNLFKSCNFKIGLRPGSVTQTELKTKYLEYVVQEVNIPGITLGQIDLTWQSLKDKRTGDSIEYNDLQLTILVDENLNAYKEIYNNLIIQHNPVTNVLEVQKQLFDGYLFLLTNKNNYQHQLHFYDCWIKSIDDIQLSHSTSEDEQLLMTMTIVYNFFIFET